MSKVGTARERHLSQSLSGRQTVAGRPGVSNVLFKPMTLIALILIGVFAFGALIVLSGFAKDLRKLPPGQATPRSVSAVGYQALTNYLEKLDYDISETRGQRDYYDRNNELVIYTPSQTNYRARKQFKKLDDEFSLIVLPKWTVHEYRASKEEIPQKGWARKTRGDSVIYPSAYRGLIEDLPVVKRRKDPSVNTQVFFETQAERNLPNALAPDFTNLQYFDLNTYWRDQLDILAAIVEAEAEERRRKRAEDAGKDYKPKEKKKSEEENAKDDEEDTEDTPDPLPDHEILMKIDGHVVLIRLEDTQTYVLSEPDLLNTMAFQTQSNAQLAGTIIDEVIWHANLDSWTVDFDVKLHGIEANRNIIKLMVTPPFLAATLCLLVAGGLVAWQGFNRFGDPARQRPDYAQGPVSLAKTAAEFMQIANRTHKTGPEYAALARRHIARDLGYKDRTLEHIDRLLDAREKRLELSPTYAELERAITDVEPQAYAHYALELARWREAMTDNDVMTRVNKQDDKTPAEEDPSA